MGQCAQISLTILKGFWGHEYMDVTGWLCRPVCAKDESQVVSICSLPSTKATFRCLQGLPPRLWYP